MRTKNRKRIGPVPIALVAVFALAAFLSVGLLLVNTGGQPAEAQDGVDCTFTVDGGTSVSNGVQTGAITAINNVAGTAITATSAGQCATTDEMATVAFKGPSTRPGGSDRPATIFVLSEDDNGDVVYYPAGTYYQIATNSGDDQPGDVIRGAGFYTEDTQADEVEPVRYSLQEVEVPLAALKGAGYAAQSVTIEVTGDFYIFDRDSFANGLGEDVFCATLDGGSRLISAAECADEVNVPGDAKRRNSQTADALVSVTLLGAPSLTQDDTGIDVVIKTNEDATDPNNSGETDPSSYLGAFTVDIDGLTTVIITDDTDTADFDERTLGDDLWVIGLNRAAGSEATTEIPSNIAGTVYVIAEVRDGDGNLLKGGKNVDSAITFTVMYADGSDMKSSANVSYSRNEEVDGNGRASTQLAGWTTGDDAGPVKVTVTASYTGPSGSNFDLGKVELARVGDPMTLTTGTYVCVTLGDDDKMKSNDGCPNAVTANRDADPPVEGVDDTKPVSDMVFGQGEVIVVMSELADMLGSDTGENVIVKLSADAKKVLSAASGGKYGAAARYMIAVEADLGMYTDGIIVSYGSGDDKLEQKLSFTVSGAAENFAFDMPAMYIPLATGMSETFTIMATDENGNVPSKSSMVEVVVLGVESSYVSGIGSDNMLEVKDGSASFEIFTPVDAEQGDTALILVRVDSTEVARLAVTFGMAPPMEPGMPTAPSGAMAAVSGNSVTVTWMDGQNVGGHGVVLFTSDFSSWPHIGMGTGETHTFDDVSSGSYIAVVVALDAQGALMTNAQGGYIYTASTVITVP